MSLTQSVWVPFGAALLGAVAGAGISWRALAWNAGKEWQRRQAQGRRVLQTEMLMNVQQLHDAANVYRLLQSAAEVPRDIVRQIRGLLALKTFSVAFHGRFAEATEGVPWEDVDCILYAYRIAALVLDDNLAQNQALEDILRRFGEGAVAFSKAIKALSKYERLEDTFYKKVERLERDAQTALRDGSAARRR